MSTVLGMMMMMPVVFGVGGYALVSRRPEINAKTMTGDLSARRQVSRFDTSIRLGLGPASSALGDVTSHESQYIDGGTGAIR
jgi:hypothetical protein